MYDFIIIDSVLMGYLILNSSEGCADMKAHLKIGNRNIYHGFTRSFIETVNYLKKKFLTEEGEIVLLFDNYESREQINQLLRPLNEHQSRKNVNASYKSQRRAERTQFYDSLEIIRHYYIVNMDKYHTARIANLEADDLVKPCIAFLHTRHPADCKILLVTNDSDWCRYINDKIQWLPELYKEPQGVVEFRSRFKFEPTEESIILNKVIYGDEADNIQAVFPEFRGDTRKFIVQHFNSVSDFMFTAHEHDETREYIKLIKQRESEIRSAYQMLATIPVSSEHFEAVFTNGRNSKIVQKTLNDAIFGERVEGVAPQQGFTFNTIKIPRYDPKGE